MEQDIRVAAQVVSDMASFRFHIAEAAASLYNVENQLRELIGQA
jgi:hypothetical protein